MSSLRRSLFNTLEFLSKSNYYLARAYYHFSLRLLDRRYKKLPILVYQMGKVGSSSVSKSLAQANVGRRIYHVHFLSPDRVHRYEQKRRKYLRTEKLGDLKHIWQYQYLERWIRKEAGKEKWKVISLVRDPVARNLSTFFENIDVVSTSPNGDMNLQSARYDFEITVNKNNLDDLIALFFEKCRHDAPLTYFDAEFKPIFDFDIYQTEFPKARGYGVFESERADFLVIRLEDLNDCIGDAMSKFLGIKDFLLRNKNIGSEKSYASLYQTFKNNIKLPESYLDKLYESKFSQYFYTRDEIQRLRKQWERKSETGEKTGIAANK